VTLDNLTPTRPWPPLQATIEGKNI
jgi:hypothetical protein